MAVASAKYIQDKRIKREERIRWTFVAWGELLSDTQSQLTQKKVICNEEAADPYRRPRNGCVCVYDARVLFLEVKNAVRLNAHLHAFLYHMQMHGLLI